MSNFISKHVSMPIGRKNKSQKFVLNTHHETTTDFFKQKPIWCQELVPGDNFNVTVNNQVRTSPLAAPTFGNYEIHNRCFFVPYRTVFKDWNSFITGTVSDVSGLWPTTVPFTTNGELVDMFLNGGPSTHFFCSSTTGTPDFVLNDWNGSEWVTSDYKFTAEGRSFFNVLASLGYQINWYRKTGDLLNPSYNDLRKMSLLPLLSYFKVIADYYVPSEFSNVWNSKILSVSSLGDIDDNSMWPLLGYTMYYGSDYFTSAWKNPVAPNNFSTNEYVTISDNTLQGVQSLSVRNTSVLNPAPFIADSANVSNPLRVISQYSIDVLQRLTNFMRRNQMSGYRVLDRYLAKYGYTLDSARLNRSILIGSDIIPFSISAVVSQTANAGSTGGTYLGDLAGYSIGRSSGKFHFDNTGSSAEFGLMLVVSSCIPETGYYQGTRRYLQHGCDSRMSFFQSEFDNLGVDAIRNDELYSTFGLGYQSGSSYSPNDIQNPSGTFAFSPRYTGDYKVGYDCLTGDFRFKSRNAGFDSYHTFRTVYDPDERIDSYPVYGQRFKQGDQQYDRIFQYTGTDYDHFIHDINISCEAYRPMVSITDSLLPEEDDEHNAKVSIQLNGTQLN